MAATTPLPEGSEIVLYQTEDQQTRLQVRLDGGTVWLTQAQIAGLFQATPQAVSFHLRALYGDGELDEGATCKCYLQVRPEGRRSVRRSLRSYNLEAILAIGYRVRSPRGVQFRQWATQRLREYLVKGFVLDDARLKEPGGFDYFDELLARIREIRASEKRFYQKVRDLYATAARPRSSSSRRSRTRCSGPSRARRRPSWFRAGPARSCRTWVCRRGADRVCASTT